MGNFDNFLQNFSEEHLEEGVFDRLKARLSGTGAQAVQIGKNFKNTAKGFARGAGGDVEGANQSFGQVKDPNDRKTLATLRSSVDSFVRDIVKLELLPKELSEPTKRDLVKAMVQLLDDIAEDS